MQRWRPISDACACLFLGMGFTALEKAKKEKELAEKKRLEEEKAAEEARKASEKASNKDKKKAMKKARRDLRNAFAEHEDFETYIGVSVCH